MVSALAKKEAYAIGIVVAVGVLLAAFSIYDARQQVRDDLRREDMANLKRILEAYYNDFNRFPHPPVDHDPCTDSNDPQSWFFSDKSPLLGKGYSDAMPHDLRRHLGYAYRYCVVTAAEDPGQGFFVEARMERNYPVGIDFDHTRARRYYYRYVEDDEGNTLYRVCGGTELQCEGDNSFPREE